MLHLAADMTGIVAGLFDRETPEQAMLFATLEGAARGDIFVDDARAPTRAVIRCGFNGWTFVGGAFDARAFYAAIDELRVLGDVRLIWSPRMAERLPPPPPAEAEIDCLEFVDRLPPAGLAGAVDELRERGCVVRAMDEPLFRRCLWRGSMLRLGGTGANFLAHHRGVCLMRGDDILCEAYAILGRGQAELGVITAEAHRGQGYATQTCAWLAAACEARGWPTSWGCRRDNAASAATARRLGYQTERAYTQRRYPSAS